MHGCIKRVCPEFRKDAKPYKHTQTLTRNIVALIINNLKGIKVLDYD